MGTGRLQVPQGAHCANCELPVAQALAQAYHLRTALTTEQREGKGTGCAQEPQGAHCAKIASCLVEQAYHLGSTLLTTGI